MPLLQVRECPEELYSTLSHTAQEENRSIAQQTVVQLRKSFDLDSDSAKKRRQKALFSTQALDLSLEVAAPSPAELLREDRDRVPNYVPHPLS